MIRLIKNKITTFDIRTTRTPLTSILMISVLMCATLTCAAPADTGDNAGSEEAEILGIRVGIEGQYKAGLWAPVEVSYRKPHTAAIELIVSDPNGTPVRYLPVNNGPTSRFYVKPGHTRGQITARLVFDDDTVIERTYRAGRAGPASEINSTDSSSDDHPTTIFPVAISSAQKLILTVGGGQKAAEDAVVTLRALPEQRPVVAAVSSASMLPIDWIGYDAVSSVILAAEDLTVYQGLDADSPQMQALEQWVRHGGQLVVAIGTNAPQILGSANGGQTNAESNSTDNDTTPATPSQAKHPLTRFVPGRLDRMITLRQAAEYEMYAGGSAGLDLNGSPDSPWLTVPYLTEVEGTVEASEGQMPLVIRRPLGLGQVIFIAADLDQPPFTGWKDRGRLTANLLAFPATQGVVPTGDRNLMHLGYDDLSGQLRSALDQFEDARPIPFSLIMGLIILYIVIIGPLDYLIVHRLLKRPILTWATFPLAVLLFTVISVVLVHQTKSNHMLLNQAEVIDIDTESGMAQGTAWAGVYSPNVARYDVQFQPLDGQNSDTQVFTSWFGLSGDSLGGMDTANLASPSWTIEYEESQDLAQISGIPIKTWSTRSMTSRWTGRSERFPSATIYQQNQSLSGTVMNTLDFTLHDCLLVHDRWAYELGQLEPGEAVRIGSNTKRRSLSTLMTGIEIVPAKSKTDTATTKPTPYNRSNTDASSVLRAMLFYQAADGPDQTKLDGPYESLIDMSRLLKTNRAVLIANRTARKVENPEENLRAVSITIPPPRGEFFVTPTDDSTDDDTYTDTNVDLSKSPNRTSTTIFRFVYPVEDRDRR